MSSYCNLLRSECVLEPFQKGPCCENPTLKEAASCINNLNQMLLDAHLEIYDQDRVIEDLKSKENHKQYAS
jgi:hypothetical protein